MTHKSVLHVRRCWLIAVSCLAVSGSALAQQSTSQPNPFQTKAGPAPRLVSDTPAQAPHTVSTGQAIYLVRSTLMTLNDANRSGNYTVLRDLAAPDFQAKNSASDLAQSFLDLRRRKFDLFSVSFSDPEFTAVPALDAGGRVHLTGYFPTEPLRIRFDLTFQSVEGQWRLFAISVATPEAPKEQSSLSRPASGRRLPAGLFYGVRLFSATGGWRW